MAEKITIAEIEISTKILKQQLSSLEKRLISYKKKISNILILKPTLSTETAKTQIIRFIRELQKISNQADVISKKTNQKLNNIKINTVSKSELEKLSKSFGVIVSSYFKESIIEHLKFAQTEISKYQSRTIGESLSSTFVEKIKLIRQELGNIRIDIQINKEINKITKSFEKMTNLMKKELQNVETNSRKMYEIKIKYLNQYLDKYKEHVNKIRSLDSTRPDRQQNIPRIPNIQTTPPAPSQRAQSVFKIDIRQTQHDIESVRQLYQSLATRNSEVNLQIKNQTQRMMSDYASEVKAGTRAVTTIVTQEHQKELQSYTQYYNDKIRIARQANLPTIELERERDTIIENLTQQHQVRVSAIARQGNIQEQRIREENSRQARMTSEERFRREMELIVRANREQGRFLRENQRQMRDAMRDTERALGRFRVDPLKIDFDRAINQIRDFRQLLTSNSKELTAIMQRETRRMESTNLEEITKGENAIRAALRRSGIEQVQDVRKAQNDRIKIESQVTSTRLKMYNNEVAKLRNQAQGNQSELTRIEQQANQVRQRIRQDFGERRRQIEQQTNESVIRLRQQHVARLQALERTATERRRVAPTEIQTSRLGSTPIISQLGSQASLITGQLGGVGSALTSLGPAGIAAGVALGGVTMAVKAGLKVFLEYEKLAQRVATLLNSDQLNQIPASMAGLRDIARKGGFGLNDLQNSLYMVISAVPSLSNNLNAANAIVEKAAKTAKGLGATTEETALAMVKLGNAMGMNMEKTENQNFLFDTMAATMKYGLIKNGSELSRYLATAAPSMGILAENAKLGTVSLSAMTAVLTGTGVEMSEAQTQIRAFSNEIMKTEKRSMLLKAGFEGLNRAGQLVDPVAFVKSLSENMDKASEVFNSIEAKNALRILAKDSGKVFASMFQDISNAGGTANEMFEKMRNTGKNAIDELKSNWNDLLLSIGENSSSNFNSILGMINSAVSALADIFEPATVKISRMNKEFDDSKKLITDISNLTETIDISLVNENIQDKEILKYFSEIDSIIPDISKSSEMVATRINDILNDPSQITISGLREVNDLLKEIKSVTQYQAGESIDEYMETVVSGFQDTIYKSVPETITGSMIPGEQLTEIIKQKSEIENIRESYWKLLETQKEFEVGSNIWVTQNKQLAEMEKRLTIFDTTNNAVTTSFSESIELMTKRISDFYESQGKSITQSEALNKSWDYFQKNIGSTSRWYDIFSNSEKEISLIKEEFEKLIKTTQSFKNIQSEQIDDTNLVKLKTDLSKINEEFNNEGLVLWKNQIKEMSGTELTFDTSNLNVSAYYTDLENVRTKLSEIIDANKDLGDTEMIGLMESTGLLKEYISLKSQSHIDDLINLGNEKLLKDEITSNDINAVNDLLEAKVQSLQEVYGEKVQYEEILQITLERLNAEIAIINQKYVDGSITEEQKNKQIQILSYYRNQLALQIRDIQLKGSALNGQEQLNQSKIRENMISSLTSTLLLEKIKLQDDSLVREIEYLKNLKSINSATIEVLKTELKRAEKYGIAFYKAEKLIKDIMNQKTQAENELQKAKRGTSGAIIKSAKDEAGALQLIRNQIKDLETSNVAIDKMIGERQSALVNLGKAGSGVGRTGAGRLGKGGADIEKEKNKEVEDRAKEDARQLQERLKMFADAQKKGMEIENELREKLSEHERKLKEKEIEEMYKRLKDEILRNEKLYEIAQKREYAEFQLIKKLEDMKEKIKTESLNISFDVTKALTGILNNLRQPSFYDIFQTELESSILFIKNYKTGLNKEIENIKKDINDKEFLRSQDLKNQQRIQNTLSIFSESYEMLKPVFNISEKMKIYEEKLSSVNKALEDLLNNIDNINNPSGTQSVSGSATQGNLTIDFSDIPEISGKLERLMSLVNKQSDRMLSNWADPIREASLSIVRSNSEYKKIFEEFYNKIKGKNIASTEEWGRDNLGTRKTWVTSKEMQDWLELSLVALREQANKGTSTEAKISVTIDGQIFSGEGVDGLLTLKLKIEDELKKLKSSIENITIDTNKILGDLGNPTIGDDPLAKLKFIEGEFSRLQGEYSKITDEINNQNDVISNSYTILETQISESESALPFAETSKYLEGIGSGLLKATGVLSDIEKYFWEAFDTENLSQFNRKFDYANNLLIDFKEQIKTLDIEKIFSDSINEIQSTIDSLDEFDTERKTQLENQKKLITDIYKVYENYISRVQELDKRSKIKTWVDEEPDITGKLKLTSQGKKLIDLPGVESLLLNIADLKGSIIEYSKQYQKSFQDIGNIVDEHYKKLESLDKRSIEQRMADDSLMLKRKKSDLLELIKHETELYKLGDEKSRDRIEGYNQEIDSIDLLINNYIKYKNEIIKDTETIDQLNLIEQSISEINLQLERGYITTSESLRLEITELTKKSKLLKDEKEYRQIILEIQKKQIELTGKAIPTTTPKGEKPKKAKKEIEEENNARLEGLQKVEEKISGITEAIDLFTSSIDKLNEIGTMFSQGKTGEGMESIGDLQMSIGKALLKSGIYPLDVMGAVLLGSGLIVKVFSKLVQLFQKYEKTSLEIAKERSNYQKMILDSYNSQIEALKKLNNEGDRSLGNSYKLYIQAKKDLNLLIRRNELAMQYYNMTNLARENEIASMKAEMAVYDNLLANAEIYEGSRSSRNDWYMQNRRTIEKLIGKEAFDNLKLGYRVTKTEWDRLISYLNSQKINIETNLGTSEEVDKAIEEIKGFVGQAKQELQNLFDLRIKLIADLQIDGSKMVEVANYMQDFWRNEVISKMEEISPKIDWKGLSDDELKNKILSLITTVNDLDDMGNLMLTPEDLEIFNEWISSMENAEGALDSLYDKTRNIYDLRSKINPKDIDYLPEQEAMEMTLDSLKEQLKYAYDINASEEYILELKAQIYDWEKKINELQEDRNEMIDGELMSLVNLRNELIRRARMEGGISAPEQERITDITERIRIRLTELGIPNEQINKLMQSFNLQTAHKGLWVPGTGEKPYLLEGGERVVSKDDTLNIGRNMLDKFIAGDFQSIGEGKIVNFSMANSQVIENVNITTLQNSDQVWRELEPRLNSNFRDNIRIWERERHKYVG